VTQPAVVPGGADAWFETLGASGIAADIASLDEPARGALLAEVRRRAEPLVDGNDLRSTLTASVLVPA